MGKGQWRIDNAISMLEGQRDSAAKREAALGEKLRSGTEATGTETVISHAKAGTQKLALNYAIDIVKGINSIEEEPPKLPHLRELRWRLPEARSKAQEWLGWWWRDKKQDAMSAAERWLRSRT